MPVPTFSGYRRLIKTHKFSAAGAAAAGVAAMVFAVVPSAADSHHDAQPAQALSAKRVTDPQTDGVGKIQKEDLTPMPSGDKGDDGAKKAKKEARQKKAAEDMAKKKTEFAAKAKADQPRAAKEAANRSQDRKPVPASPPAPAPSDQVITPNAYLTGYSYWDNTPPGSGTISNPVIHKTADGTGTYADPITVAVAYSGSKLEFPAGTKFYVPNVRRYFIVEDTNSMGWEKPASAAFHLDLYVGGQSNQARSEAAMNAITGTHTVVRNPASNYAVVRGEITANYTQYGEKLVTQ